MSARRVRVRVTGTVQGVGFRPYVHRLAHALELSGFVLNDVEGVLIEAEGPGERIDSFLGRLPREAPPLARVEGVGTAEAPVRGDAGFSIAATVTSGSPDALVSPDAATCPECLAELFDPANRRHRYPFVNCTNCGPRFTIVVDVPYDRPATTMAGFEMCPACRSEYDDPRDRRFHAQPNACPACGPRAWLAGPGGEELDTGDDDAVSAAARMIATGSVLAVKGIGGFHLACTASDEEAVSRLRGRKHREDRPFALLARDLATARELVDLGPAEEALLEGPERPIVVARRRPGAHVAAAVAPRSADLGVLLPYSPLHHLLAADAAVPLVLTSGNVSDEPIAYDNADALARLPGIADAFLMHDRPIRVRTDDSVVRAVDPAVGGGPLVIRRSRGYVPASLGLNPPATVPILGCGAELKSTFCLARGNRAWVGHHIGDLKNYETVRSFIEGEAHFERLFAVEPRVVAHDAHPDYLSTRHALEREDAELVAVQHHHAHLASCLAEHGELGPAVGAIFDGSGFGGDGTVWGGEILFGDLASFERAGLLFPVRLPGGDAAVREPWRMACAWLSAAFDDTGPPIPQALKGEVSDERWSAVAELVRTGISSPLTTSAGRLFDAVAAIAGVRATVTSEGQAAAELEGLADLAESGEYPFETAGSGPLILDVRPAVQALRLDLEAGAGVPTVSARFHNTLASVTSVAVARVAEERSTDIVVLSGGVFQNRLLVERTAARLTRKGLRVLLPRELPPNDGGISYGQVAVAAATLTR